MLVLEDSLIRSKHQKLLSLNKNSLNTLSQVTQPYSKESRGFFHLVIIIKFSTGELTKADDAELKSILEAFIPEAGLAMKA